MGCVHVAKNVANKQSHELLDSMRLRVLLDWLSHHQGLEKGFALLGTLMIVVNILPCCIGCWLLAVSYRLVELSAMDIYSLSAENLCYDL